MSDLVSLCCGAPYKMVKHDGGRSPVCKKCQKRTNVGVAPIELDQFNEEEPLTEEQEPS